jgi:hypothetical protein
MTSGRRTRSRSNDVNNTLRTFLRSAGVTGDDDMVPGESLGGLEGPRRG